MLKNVVWGAVIAGSFVFNVAAEDRVDQRSPGSARPTAVQLSDAELDQITAGKVVLILNSSPISLFINEVDRTICINCNNTAPGTLTTPNGKIITFH